MSLFFAWCLYNDQEVVFVGGDHHFVLSAGDTQEGQIVRGVQITHEVPRLPGQLGQFETIVSCLSALVHGASHEDRLRIISLLIFSIVYNKQTLHTLVLSDSLDSLVYLASLSSCS